MAEKDGLDDNWKDKLVAVSKGAASFVPYAGGPIAEIIGAVVRGQRADRVAAYLRALAERVDDLEAKVVRGQFDEPEKINLIEEGAYQAARALSPERIAAIVEAVAQGLAKDEAELVRRKRLLTLFSEIDDDELAMLNAHGKRYGTGNWTAFEELNQPEPTHMQSSVDEIDSSKLYMAGEEHLLRLGLLHKRYAKPPRGQTLDFDPSKGDFKHSVEISYLGRMLLREIGMTPPFDADEEP